MIKAGTIIKAEVGHYTVEKNILWGDAITVSTFKAHGGAKQPKAGDKLPREIIEHFIGLKTRNEVK